jgi:phage portal protein BeeE
MFNWLSDRFRRQDRSPAVDRLRAGPAPHIAAVARHEGYPQPPVPLTHLGAYGASSWVYVAVNRIAEAAALVPLHVYRLDGEQRIAVERHPLEALLDYPNPLMSCFELFEQTVGMLELTGNAYWFLAGDARGRPAEIWPLRPDRIAVVPDPVRAVAGYLYEIDGQRIPLEAARLAVQSDRAMAEWNRSTFGQDNGVPAGIVSIKEFVSDTDFERIKREWRSSYGGGQRRTAFLRGGTVDWQSIGLSHTDLDFLQGRKAHRDEILNIFGVPVGLVSENATEANAKVAERHFIERTLWPKLVRLDGKISQELLPFWGEGYVAAFEDIRPTDTQARLAEVRAAYPVLSINEIRQRYFHLPPVAWGDSPSARRAVTSTPEAGPIEVETESPVLPDTAQKGIDPNAELAAWERFALRRLGRSGRAFVVRALPEDIAFEVSAGLHIADSPQAVRALFAAARTALSTGTAPSESESA